MSDLRAGPRFVVNRLALALPHVMEIDSEGFDFRVGDEAEKQALLLGEPELFFTAAGYDGQPLVMLRLPEVDTSGRRAGRAG